jgi:autoinducer binding domain-containing protein
MSDLLERFAEAVPNMETVEAVERAYQVALGELGFPFLTYGNVLMGNELVRSSLKTTVDPVWWAHYVRQDYAMIDPILAQIPYRTGPYTWDETRARASVRGHQCLNEAEESGLTNGLAVALRRPGSLHAVSMAGRDEPVDLLERVTVGALTEIFHGKRWDLDRGEKGPFTPKQMEIMHWRAEGKTFEDLAQICGNVPRVAKRHMKEASDRLGTQGSLPLLLIGVGTGILMPHWLRPQIREDGDE